MRINKSWRVALGAAAIILLQSVAFILGILALLIIFGLLVNLSIVAAAIFVLFGLWLVIAFVVHDNADSDDD